MRYLPLILLLFFACSKKVTTVTKEESTVLDSTFMTETIQYDTVFVAGDTVKLKEWIECDKNTNKPIPFKAKGKVGRASVKVTLDTKGTLSVEGVCDSLIKVVETKDKEIFRLRQEVNNKKTVIEKKPTQFKIWFDWTCRILAGLFLLLVALFVFKHYR